MLDYFSSATGTASLVSSHANTLVPARPELCPPYFEDVIAAARSFAIAFLLRQDAPHGVAADALGSGNLVEEISFEAALKSMVIA